MKIPGPDHPISIAPHHGRVRVHFAGRLVAETRRALRLDEASYRSVLYIPRDDAAMTLMQRTDHHTTCPYKGEASHYSIVVDCRIATNAAWSYEQPYPAMRAIAGYLAFYPGRVDAIEEA